MSEDEKWLDEEFVLTRRELIQIRHESFDNGAQSALNAMFWTYVLNPFAWRLRKNINKIREDYK